MDRDLDTVIKCPVCNKLHCALMSIIPNTSPRAKMYKCTGPPPGDYSIPTRITSQIVRAIMKLHDRKQDYQHLIRQINTSRTYVRDDGILNQIAHISRVCSGHLILRTQQIWAMQELDISAVQELTVDQSDIESYVYSTGPELPESLCLHLSWGDQIHSLCDTHRPPSATVNGIGYDRNSARPLREEQYHLCPPFRMLATREFMRLVPVTGVTGCARCQTDYQVELTRLPPPFGAGILLTTWKDLGRGTSAGDDPWASHDILIATPDRPSTAFGKIREQFDTVDGICTARPGVTDSNMYQIRTVADEVERNGNDIAIAEAPDEDTGLISQFVPVDHNGFPAGS